MGSLVNIEKTEKENLYVVLVDEVAVRNLSQKDLNSDEKWKALLEDVDGYSSVDSGTRAMTSAPLIGEDGAENLYWFPSYETEDEIEILLRDGRVYFPRLEE